MPPQRVPQPPASSINQEIEVAKSFNRLILAGRVAPSAFGITTALHRVLLTHEKDPGSVLEVLTDEVADAILSAVTLEGPSVHMGKDVDQDWDQPVCFPRAIWRCSAQRVRRLSEMAERVGVGVGEKVGVRVSHDLVFTFREHVWMAGLASSSLDLEASCVVTEVLRTLCGPPTMLAPKQWKE